MFQDVPDEVVIRFQVCIFDILNTAFAVYFGHQYRL